MENFDDIKFLLGRKFPITPSTKAAPEFTEAPAARLSADRRLQAPHFAPPSNPSQVHLPSGTITPGFDTGVPGLERLLMEGQQVSPETGFPPAIGTGGPVPIGDKPSRGFTRPEIQFNTVFPTWTTPNFQSQISDKIFDCAGVVWYDTWFTIQTYVVPDDSIFTMRGFFIEIPFLAVGEIFELAVFRDMECVLPSFKSIKISSDPNPANQYAFGGAQSEIWCPVIFRPAQQMSIRLKVLGAEGAGKTDTSPFNSPVITTLAGWTTQMPNPSDRANQPVLGGNYVGR